MALHNPRFRYSKSRRYLQVTPSPFFRVRLNAAKITLLLGSIFALILFVLDLRRDSITHNLRSMVVDATMPLISFGTHATQKLTTNVNALVDANHQHHLALKAKDETVLLWKLEAQRLKQENTVLRDALNYKNTHMFKGITTELVELTALKLQHKALLPVGGQQGVTKNSVVINNLGLVGKVVSVGGKTAQLIKLENSFSAVPVYVERTQQKCVVKGGNSNDSLVLAYVNLGDLQDGDRLLTSGIAGVYPRGVQVAIVETINEERVLMPVYRKSSQPFVYVLQATGVDIKVPNE